MSRVIIIFDQESQYRETLAGVVTMKGAEPRQAGTIAEAETVLKELGEGQKIIGFISGPYPDGLKFWQENLKDTGTPMVIATTLGDRALQRMAERLGVRLENKLAIAKASFWDEWLGGPSLLEKES